MKKFFSVFMTLVLTSCATTMPGHDVDTGSKKVSATMSDNDSFSDHRIQMHQFSIKNNTDEWIEFEGATIEGPEEVKVLVGDRITSWVEACTLEQQVSDYNTALVLGSLAIAGVAVSGGTQHQGTATTGAVVALGSITALGAKGFQESKRWTEFQQAFPEKHIFRPFVLPPGKVIQRWIMIENPSSKPFTLTAKSKSGFQLKVNIKRHITPAMYQ